MRSTTLLYHLLLLLVHPVSSDNVTKHTDVILPGCSCHGTSPLQSVVYLTEDNIVDRLQRWEHKVTNIRVGPWVSTKTSGTFYAPSIANTPSLQCKMSNLSQRSVDYDLPIVPPIFLRPFVGDIYAHQSKIQTLYICPTTNAFLFKEDCHITNLPIIGEIYLTVTTVLTELHPPVAHIEIHHKELPWYMSFVEPKLLAEIITKTQNLWKITVTDLCECQNGR